LTEYESDVLTTAFPPQAAFHEGTAFPPQAAFHEGAMFGANEASRHSTGTAMSTPAPPIHHPESYHTGNYIQPQKSPPGAASAHASREAQIYIAETTARVHQLENEARIKVAALEEEKRTLAELESHGFSAPPPTAGTHASHDEVKYDRNFTSQYGSPHLQAPHQAPQAAQGDGWQGFTEAEKNKVLVAAEWAAEEIRKKVRERDGRVSSEPDFDLLVDKIKKDVLKKRGTRQRESHGGSSNEMTVLNSAYTPHAQHSIAGHVPNTSFSHNCLDTPQPPPSMGQNIVIHPHPGSMTPWGGLSGGVVRDETVYATGVVPAKVIQLAINPTYDVNTRFVGHDVMQTRHDLDALSHYR